MNTREMKLADIIPAHYNPRVPMSLAERKELLASLDTFGVVEPLVWNRRTGRLVGGHQRLSLLLERGDTEGVVSVVDLSEEEEKALNVALNREGRWDEVKLEALLDSIAVNELRLAVGLKPYDDEALPDVPVQVGAKHNLNFVYPEDEADEVKAALKATGASGPNAQLLALVRS